MKFKILFVLIITGTLLIVSLSVLHAAKWEEWELGGEIGLGIGSAADSGRILSPVAMVTGTKIIEDRFLELGLGYMFGSNTEINYTKKDAEYYSQDVIDGAEKEVTVRLKVIPMTINFHYIIYENFYVGAGIGLYHVFYSRVPLEDDWRVDPDSEPGEIVKSPATTALGFQQMIGMEVFPLSEKWKWFVGIKSFITTKTPKAGSLLGITIGGKLRYIW